MDDAWLKSHIRDIPDFPHPGILFRDITPLLAAPVAFKRALTALTNAAPPQVTHVAAIEARGFIFGAAVAATLKVPFVPVRKDGKLPRQTLRADYHLEYGIGSLFIHTDALAGGGEVFIIDDLIATGGSLAAAVELIKRGGGNVAASACVIELVALNGRARLSDIPLTSLVRYDE